MAYVLSYDIAVSEFELQSCYNVHFQTALGEGVDPLLPPLAIRLIVPQLFFFKDSFGIK